MKMSAKSLIASYTITVGSALAILFASCARVVCAWVTSHGYNSRQVLPVGTLVSLENIAGWKIVPTNFQN